MGLCLPIYGENAQREGNSAADAGIEASVRNLGNVPKGFHAVASIEPIGGSWNAANENAKERHLVNQNTDDEDGYPFDGKCQACDTYGPVDDMSFCPQCGGKFERDMIRQREWDYSASAFGLSDEDRERLRRQVIEEYGAKLELIAPSKKRR